MTHKSCLPVALAVLAMGCEANSPTETVDQSIQGLNAKSERGSITCDPQTADSNADGYVCTRLSDKRCAGTLGHEALEYRDNSLGGTNDPVGRCPGKWALDAVPHPWQVVYEDPSKFAFTGVWGSSATDVYVTGTEGAIVHFDGVTWTSQISGTSFVVFDVWGSSSTNVFAAVGDDDDPTGQVGAILHSDGVSWTHEVTDVPYLVGIWGSSPSDVFAVGRWGTILHFDGHQWSQQASGTSETLWDVWGSSPTNVFAVGSAGTILHYDGTTWSPQVSGTSAVLRGIWANSETSAFAVGEGSSDGATTVLAYNGSSWSVANNGFTALTMLLAVWGRSPTDVYAVGNGIWRYDGSAWTNEVQPGAGLWGIWGSNTETYAVGFDFNSAKILRTRY